jgi:tetratricopeptide (TPR) repeat protein
VEVVGVERITNVRRLTEQERDRALLAVFVNPFDPIARLRLGQMMLELGQPGPAHAQLSAALAFRRDLDEARYLRARAAFLLRRWADAATDATRYLDRHPDTSPGRDRMLRLYNRARFLEGHPDSEDARRLRARAWMLARRFEEAVRDYTALIERHPRDPRLYTWRAACYEALGQADRAKADWKQARAVTPPDAGNLSGIAWELATGPEEERDPPQALSYIQAAVRQNANNANLLYTLGVVQYRNGQYGQALAAMEKSLALSKGEGDANAFDLFFLAMCHGRLGDAARARDCFGRAVRSMARQTKLSPQGREQLSAFRAEAEAELRKMQAKP